MVINNMIFEHTKFLLKSKPEQKIIYAQTVGVWLVINAVDKKVPFREISEKVIKHEKPLHYLQTTFTLLSEEKGEGCFLKQLF